MSLIEDAARRLEELRRAGVHAVPPAPVEAPARTDAAPAARRAELDLARLRDRGFLAPGAPRSALSDELRVIKRPLIANVAGTGAAPVRNANLIMVTSALPGEGKTFTALNLALSIADEVDRTVLLVDADVARPALPALLGLPPSRGLLDVVQNRSLDVGEVLIPTSIRNLTVLLGGTPTPRATELLASQAMVRLVESIGKRYPDRIVIFDSPPVLVTTESRVMASHVGQIVFVVHAEKTLQAQVRQALAAIEACPVKLLVLNRVESHGQGGYGYGYGYGYSGYGTGA